MAGPGVPSGNPPPNWRTFLRTLAPALRARNRFRDVQSYALFIGQNRSGSSLVGSLLNAHRHALIAHELNALHFVRRRFTRTQLYWLLQEQDRAFADSDRRWYGYDYRIAGQWQGRSERLLVIGDKHAGGATRALRQRPELLDKLRRRVGVPVKLVHVVRQPLDNIATIHRLQQLSLADAAEYFFQHAETNRRVMDRGDADVRTVHLEDLIQRPAAELAELLAFLGLDAPPDYLAACSAAVFAEPRRTRDSLVWPASLVRDIAARCRNFSFYDRYAAELTRFVSHCGTADLPRRAA